MAKVENNKPATGGATGAGWLPGQSGNPGGRPKGIASRARELAGGNPDKLLQVLLDVAGDEAAKASDRVTAAREYLDRGWGRSASYAPVDGDPLDLSDDERTELEAVLDELASRRAAKAPTAGKKSATG